MPKPVPLYELAYDEHYPQQHIALTFDDGPDTLGNTEHILSILAEHHIPGTFFLNANWLHFQQDPTTYQALQQTVRRILAEGHEIGNHGARHVRFTTLSDQALRDNINLLEQDVASIVDRSNLKLTLLRAPYGEPMYPQARTQPHSPFERVARIIAEKAVHIGWNYDPMDWHATSEQDIVDGVLEQIEKNHRQGGIILLHCNTQYTVAALPLLIEALEQLGFQFVHCETLVQQKYGQTSYPLIYNTTTPK